MKITQSRIYLAIAIASAAIPQMAAAATISSITFDVDPASTSINTTGSGVVDWGYFLPNADFLDGTQAADTDFDALTANTGSGVINPATNSKSTSGIGIVTITERGAGEYSNGNTGQAWAFTVNDGISPVSGTQNPLGAVNGIAPGEDIFNITLNDLLVGDSTITLYMDHTSNSRQFNVTADLFASDGNDLGNALLSPQIGGADGEGYFTLTVDVSSAVAGSDLSISIDSVSGGFGQFQFAGYTVTQEVASNTVPEPATATLGLIGLAGLLVRRRRAA